MCVALLTTYHVITETKFIFEIWNQTVISFLFIDIFFLKIHFETTSSLMVVLFIKTDLIKYLFFLLQFCFYLR